MSFSETGFVSLGKVIAQDELVPALIKIRESRPWGPGLFIEEAKFREAPVMKGVNPRPGRNLLETVDTTFVESNYEIREYLRAILGPVTTVLDKKVVAATPPSWIPDWVKKEIAQKPVPNLGAYINPRYRDVTYFHGIDWHQDIIDYPGREADFVTLYVYLDQVTATDSPLHVLPGSHALGATTFPHDIVPLGGDLWRYEHLTLEALTLTGPPGAAYLWHGLTLHGTRPTATTTGNRVSLRYVIAKQGRNGYLLDEVNAKIRGPLSLGTTRVDLDPQGAPLLTGNALNET